jgi:hypothetical protein
MALRNRMSLRQGVLWLPLNVALVFQCLQCFGSFFQCLIPHETLPLSLRMVRLSPQRQYQNCGSGRTHWSLWSAAAQNSAGSGVEYGTVDVCWGAFRSLDEAFRPLPSFNTIKWFAVRSAVGSDWLPAGRSRDRSSSPDGVKNVHFYISSRPAVRSTQPPIHWVPGDSFHGGKAAGAWSWPLIINWCRGQGNVEWSYTSTPHTPSWCSA